MFLVIFCFCCLTRAIIVECNDEDDSNSINNNDYVSAELIETFSLSSTDIVDILEAHNTVRRRENATDMQYMNWSNELAILASNWTKRCTFDHRPKGTRILNKNEDVGETIFFTTHSMKDKLSWFKIIEKYYEQKSCFDFKTGRCVETKCVSRQCGHYVQIVRNDTNFVGCGLSKCQRIGSGYVDGYVIVCNYYKFANWVNNEIGNLPIPYTPSDAQNSVCSQCPKMMPHCFYGLCRNCSDKLCPITTTTVRTTTTTFQPTGFNFLLADVSKSFNYRTTKSTRFSVKSNKMTTKPLPYCKSNNDGRQTRNLNRFSLGSVTFTLLCSMFF